MTLSPQDSGWFTTAQAVGHVSAANLNGGTSIACGEGHRLMPVTRPDARAPHELRPVTIARHWSIHPEGSVLVEFGQTRVLCTASVTDGVPRWRKGSGLGWVTCEYAMLPRSTNTRSDRESVKGRIGGLQEASGPRRSY